MPLDFATPTPIDPPPLNLDQLCICRYRVDLDRNEIILDYRAYQKVSSIDNNGRPVTGYNLIGNSRQVTVVFDQAAAILGPDVFQSLYSITKGNLYQLLQGALALKGQII